MKDTLQRPSFKAALPFWCKLGWISFGGTAAHIALMHDELVSYGVNLNTDPHVLWRFPSVVP